MELQGHTSPYVENILRRDNHAKIRGDFIPWKKLQQYQVKLAEVKIKPIDLPKPSPLKGGHEKIRKKIQELLKEDITEKGGSHLYNKPVWPELKPKGQYSLTGDYRNLN